MVTTYASDHADDLFRMWEAERPFELHLEGVLVRGRAGVGPAGQGAPRRWHNRRLPIG